MHGTLDGHVISSLPCIGLFLFLVEMETDKDGFCLTKNTSEQAVAKRKSIFSLMLLNRL